jgi:hypothetical protein
MAMSEHSVEYEYEEYYEEEEVLSYFDSGLSTIIEGENESCSDISITLEASKSPRLQMGSFSTSIPDNISLNYAMTNSLQMLSLDSPCMSLTSPGMLSKPKSKAYNIAALISPPSLDKKFQSVNPKLPPKLPLSLTSYMTGEEVVLNDDDDDEYTFVTCSDTDSHMNTSLTDLSLASTGSKRSISSKGSYKSASSMPLDFESTRSRLRKALEMRRSPEQNSVEKMDVLRRRLNYDLSRKMFKEQMARNCRSS